MQVSAWRTFVCFDLTVVFVQYRPVAGESGVHGFSDHGLTHPDGVLDFGLELALFDASVADADINAEDGVWVPLPFWWAMALEGHDR